ncbi:MAG: acyltransferase [Proteobacteria bacterium]|nr:acyltransferase [Pseudomonadota bacterium]
MSNGASRNWPELDGLRGLAILLVLGFHYGWGFFTPVPGSLFAYALVPIRLMWSGVDLFFILSGFLIVGILIRERDDERYFSVFFARRACRILPLYILTGLIFAAGVVTNGLGWIDMPRLFGDVQGWQWSALFLQNFFVPWQGTLQINFFSPTWSLAIEEQMYVILSLMVFALRQNDRAIAVALVGSAFAAIVLRAAIERGYPAQAQIMAALLPFTRMDAFAAGGLLAYAMHRGWLAYNRATGWAVAAIAVGLTGMAVLAHDNLFGVQLFLPVILTYAALLALVVTERPGTFIMRLFRNQILRWLGAISYGLYLLHIPVLGGCMALAGMSEQALVSEKPNWITLIALAILFPLAYASHRYFETPVTRWGREKWKYHSSRSYRN